MKANKTLLTKLLNVPGIPGREEAVASILEKEIKKNKLEIERDNLGSIWGVKKSSNPKAKTLLIDSHMDEVGFLVTDITDRGYIKFQNFGGVWPLTLISQRLRVWTADAKKSYTGVTLIPGANTHQKKGGVPEVDKLLLDIGMDTKDAVEKLGIRKGSMITFDTEAVFNGNRVISRAADNRVGVTMVVQLMKFIGENEFDYNIVIGASVQEEVGLRGARTSTYKIKPDLAMVIDVSPAMDIPAPKEPYGVLGAGTMIRHKDNATIYPKSVIDYIRKIAKAGKVQTQDYFSMGGTNAGVIHLWEEGRPVLPFGVVARNLHTSSTVFDLGDYEQTLDLIELILKDLNSNKIVKFK